jgi:hypothetical protein
VVTESLEPREPRPVAIKCACGGIAHRVMSAPKTATVWLQAVSTGKSDPIPPGGYDTSAIADGKMTTKEWRKARNKLHSDRRYKRIKHDLGL